MNTVYRNFMAWAKDPTLLYCRDTVALCNSVVIYDAILTRRVSSYTYSQNADSFAQAVQFHLVYMIVVKCVKFSHLIFCKPFDIHATLSIFFLSELLFISYNIFADWLREYEGWNDLYNGFWTWCYTTCHSH